MFSIINNFLSPSSFIIIFFKLLINLYIVPCFMVLVRICLERFSPSGDQGKIGNELLHLTVVTENTVVLLSPRLIKV